MNYQGFRRLLGYINLKKFIFLGLGLVVLYYAVMLYRSFGSVYRDPKTDINVYCKPFAKQLGPSFLYPAKKDSLSESPQRVEHEWAEYKTSAGFNMRIPVGMGYLDYPNEHCEMQSGTFRFLWHEGKLWSMFDYSEDVDRKVGTMVEYFVRFGKVTDPPLRKYEMESWKMEGAFRMPDYPKIWVLPFFGYSGSQYLPFDRKDTANWNAGVILEDARDPMGNAAIFTCNQFQFTERSDAIYTEVVYRGDGTCRSGINFESRSGGGLYIRYIHGENFLDRGATITNAVIKELNTYIIKE